VKSGMLDHLQNPSIEKVFLENSREKAKSRFLEYDNFINCIYLLSESVFSYTMGEELLVILSSFILFKGRDDKANIP
jgi:hypothetical protein